MSEQATWRKFFILLGSIAVGLLLLCGGAGLLLSQLGDTTQWTRGWSVPPFGNREIAELNAGRTVRMFDSDSAFMLIAPGDMRADALRPHRLVMDSALEDLIKGHESEKGPWLAGSLDQKTTFVRELPAQFQVTTSLAYGGYFIKAAPKADGTITLILLPGNHTEKE